MEIYSRSRYLLKNGVYWIHVNDKRIKFRHEIWIEESPLIDKILEDLRPKITASTKVNYFIDNKKT